MGPTSKVRGKGGEDRKGEEGGGRERRGETGRKEGREGEKGEVPQLDFLATSLALR